MIFEKHYAMFHVSNFINVMTNERQNTGKLGEDIAAKYLENKGYKILTRNYRKPWGEIDIIAEKKGTLVFIEVKTQKAGFEWRPEENVNRHKKAQLSRIINTYLKDSQVRGLINQETDWQIDVLAIELDFNSKNARVEHIENILLS